MINQSCIIFAVTSLCLLAALYLGKFNRYLYQNAGSMIIEISVKSYIRDFIIYLNNGQHPVEVSKRNSLGRLVYIFSEKVPEDCRLVTTDISSRRKLELDVGFLGSKNQLRKNPDYYFYIPREKQRVIEDIYNDVFFELFYNYVDQNREMFEKQIKESIEKFCFEREISFDNITFEALKKSYYRYRKTFDEKSLKS